MRRFPLSPFPGISGSSGRSPAWRLGPFSLSPQRVLSLVLSVLLLATFLESWAVPLPAAHASSTLPSPPASMTFQQFLKEGRHDKVYHGPLTGTLPPSPKPQHPTDYAHLPPSAEPPTMKPIIQALSASFLQSGSSSASRLDLLGSDGRLEVRIQPGTFDVSHAIVSGGSQPVGALSLQLTQLQGYYVGQSTSLGSYQLQLVDSRGQALSGVQLRNPITLVYHYQQAAMDALGLDPGRVVLSIPQLIAAALKAKKPVTPFELLMQNDPTTHTLTAQSTALTGLTLNLTTEPQNQSPPTLHLASVQGNSGQLTYSYPLQVPPGPGGFQPQLQLNYSSSGPNERHAATTPAGDVGDGWSLSLGSISEETYGSTQWYFLNDVAGTGDRLIPTGSNNLYDTQHISYLRIQQVNPGTATTCFHIWEKAGTYYELGCTADSLQYWTDGNGIRHNYRWDVNKIVAPNEGSSSGTYKMILAKYVQDSVTSSGHTTIRDAAIEQITYGVTSNPNTALSSITGTVDFHYYAPTAHPPFADAYPSTNYNCTGTPPDGTSTTWRCDDPIQKSGGFTAPTVFSTLSLQWVTSYVSDDSSSSRKDVRYDFTYSDTPYQNCTDPLTLAPGYCAGEHVLMSITPTVYQSGTAHQLKGVVFGYTTPQQDTYFDSTQTVGGQPY